jgi:hypothetical protein
MPLLGNGALTIWNGIAPEAEAEFVAWHVSEHIPERIGLPGFKRGRRYIVAEGQPKYFNFYETSDVEVLTSEAYRASLNAPTEWTRRVVRHFRDTSRTVCRVAVSFGNGEGGWIETLRVSAIRDSASFVAVMSDALGDVSREPGIVAAHLLEGQPEASSGVSAEKAMRAQPDQVVAWVLLIEAVDRESLYGIRSSFLTDQRLRDLGVDGNLDRGTYAYQFGLAHADVCA